MGTRTYFRLLLLVSFTSLASASELSLTLVETIQLPGPTVYWDVLPRWDGSYDWVAAYADSNTNTVIGWGNTATGQRDAITLESAGGPNSLPGFLHEGEFCAVVGVWRRYEVLPEYEWVDTTTVRLLMLTDGRLLTPVRTWSGRGLSTGYSARVTDRNRLVHCVMMPTAPESSERVVGVVTRSHYSYQNHGGSSSRESGCVIDNLLTQFALDTAEVESLGSAASCLQGDDPFLMSWGAGSSHDDSPSPIYSYALDVLSWNLSDSASLAYRLPTLSGQASDDWPFPNPMPSVHACTRTQRGIPLAVMSFSIDSLVGVDLSTGDRLWEQNLEGSRLSTMLAANVVLWESSEQILVYLPDSNRFTIMQSDGTIIGESTVLPQAPAEMRIVGRYQTAYRRLAVRYEDEIHVYAFGSLPRPVSPVVYDLSVYPNPFNSLAEASFWLSGGARVRLSILNVLGQEAKLVTDEILNAGSHTVTINGRDLASGLYFLSLDAGASRVVTKMVLLK